MYLFGMWFTPDEEAHIESGSVNQLKQSSIQTYAGVSCTGERFDVLGWEEKQKSVTKNRLLRVLTVRASVPKK